MTAIAAPAHNALAQQAAAPVSPPAASAAFPDEPMFGSLDSIWGSLGLAYRLRMELRENMDLDAGHGDTSILGLQRARLHLDLNWKQWLEVFVQFQDSRSVGYGNSSVYYNGNSDLHQAWVMLKAGKVFSLKVGRMMVNYGDQRLVGALEWSNVGRVLDGVQARLMHGLGWIDLFGAAFTPDSKGNLADGTFLFGAYDSLAFASGALAWDQYVLGLVDTPGALAEGTVLAPGTPRPEGPERGFATIGTRLRLKLKGVDAGVEAALQYGLHRIGYESGQDSIDHLAWALHADLKYVLPVPMGPYFRLEFNHASGNGGETGSHWNRFDNLYPTNHMHYGALDMMNWSNTFNASAGLGFSPAPQLVVRADWWIFARASDRDGWYSASAVQLAPPPDPAAPGPHDDDLILGNEVEIHLDVTMNKHFALITGFGLFLPAGYALVRGSDPQYWGFTMLNVTL